MNPTLLEQIENIVNNESHSTFWRKKKVVFRIVMILVCAVLVIYISYTSFLGRSSDASDIQHAQGTPLSKSTLGTDIYVDLSGAVISPGVYKLQPGTRLFALIEKAGGLNIDADREFIARNYNLAVPLSDEQKIYIPTIYDIQSGLLVEQQKIVTTEIDQVSDMDSVAQRAGNSTADGSSSYVSINSDDMSELMSLPGIGEVTAQRIIAARPYKSVEDVVEKGVIKQTLFDKIKDRLAP